MFIFILIFLIKLFIYDNYFNNDVVYNKLKHKYRYKKKYIYVDKEVPKYIYVDNT